MLVSSWPRPLRVRLHSSPWYVADRLTKTTLWGARHKQLRDGSLLKKDVCYVDGAWVPARSGRTFAVHDPATGEAIGTSPECGADDARAAIAAAAGAGDAFRVRTGRDRARMLRRWYDLMLENADDLAALITWENGKPLAEARVEATYAASFLEWFAEEAPRVYGYTIPASTPGNAIATYKEPVGVCALLTPWSAPSPPPFANPAPAPGSSGHGGRDG